MIKRSIILIFFIFISYVFFGVELIRSGGEANDFSWYKAGDKNNRKAKIAYESFLSLAVRVPTSAEYSLFVAKVVERANAAAAAAASENSGNSGNSGSSGKSSIIDSVNVGLRPKNEGGRKVSQKGS